MPPTDREADLIRTAISVLAGLAVATEHADHHEIAVQVGRLLNAVARYNATLGERPGDAALRRAVAALNKEAAR